jgi:hypothetical protein
MLDSERIDGVIDESGRLADYGVPRSRKGGDLSCVACDGGMRWLDQSSRPACGERASGRRGGFRRSLALSFAFYLLRKAP